MGWNIGTQRIWSLEHLGGELAKGNAFLTRFGCGQFGAYRPTSHKVDPFLLAGSHRVVAESESIHVGVKVLHALVQPAHQRQSIADHRRVLEGELFGRVVHGHFQRAHRRVALAVEKGPHRHRRVAIRLRCSRTDARTSTGAEVVAQTTGSAGAARATTRLRARIVVKPEGAAATGRPAGNAHDVIMPAVAQAGAFGKRPHGVT